MWKRNLGTRARGYAVLGVDISAAMVTIARQRVPEGQFVAGSFLDFKVPECRAVTALGEVFNYWFNKRNGLPSTSS